MQKTYLIAITLGLISGTYLYGFYSGKSKCMEQIATKTSEIAQQQTAHKEKINAEIYRTSTNNIRNILRTKYSIAD